MDIYGEASWRGRNLSNIRGQLWGSGARWRTPYWIRQELLVWDESCWNLNTRHISMGLLRALQGGVSQWISATC